MNTTADWDLTPYFPTPLGPEYVTFRDALEADLARLLTVVDTLDGVSLIEAQEDALSRVSHLASYLGCMAAADSEDAAIRRETARRAAIGAAYDKVVARVKARLAAMSDAAFDQLVAEPTIAGTAFQVRRMRDKARYQMSPELEALALDLSVDGIRAWGRLYDRVTGMLSFTLTQADGSTETLPMSMARTLGEDPDPTVRRRAKAATAAAWEGVQDSLAACLNGISGTRLTLDRQRGVAHFLDPALFDDRIERATLDTMLDAIRSRQDICRRYLTRKAERLGMERLDWPDLGAPLPGDDTRVPWADAEALVTRAFHSYDPQLGAFAERAFQGRWIDHTPRPAKRPGGFCSSSWRIGESRIFMTYAGAMGDVRTLAHELGHAFHNWVMRDMRPLARGYASTLAESASMFAEQLAADAVLEDPATTDAVRLQVLDRRLSDATGSLVNIIARFDFEHELYTRRAAGELSTDELQEMMLRAQRRNYGDALGELDPWFWASKLHYYITSRRFYNYPYAFGYLFSLGVFHRAKAAGPGFVPTYIELLRRTGTQTAEDLAADMLGVDLRKPAFWQQTLDAVATDLARYEA